MGKSAKARVRTSKGNGDRMAKMDERPPEETKESAECILQCKTFYRSRLKRSLYLMADSMAHVAIDKVRYQ